MDFKSRLQVWYDNNKRDLPWRKEKDPYKVWVSEIVLQQTRVDQGIAYYERFVKHFPTIKKLANAREDQVLKQWEGLGYYSRARNLHKAAKQVVADYNGQLPKDYQALKSLKGVGEYTAGAIASFAFNLPYPAVDGNVYRFLSRYFGVDIPIDTGAGKKYFYDLVLEIQDKQSPGEFNQALIEFGALQCTPKSVCCEVCVYSSSCSAKQTNSIQTLPVKKSKVKVKQVFHYYFVLKNTLGYIVEKREGKGIWENLYQFPLLETFMSIGIGDAVDQYSTQRGIKSEQISIDRVFGPIKHVLSHRIIQAYFIEFDLEKGAIQQHGRLFTYKEIEELPFSVLIKRYLEDRGS